MSKFQNYLKTFDITSTLNEEDIDKTLALLQIYGPAVRRTASRIGEMEEECYEGRRQSISDFINLAIDYDRDTDRKRIADRLAEMGHSMQLLSVMEDALVLVKDTPPNGGTYFNILQARYFDVYCTSNEEACVFAGGGSLLLRGMIERGNKVAFPIFVEDIHANARGYELLYQSEVAANGQQ